MVSYTPQSKHKNNLKASTDCAERCWMLYDPCDVLSSASAVKLTTDSYQFIP